MKYEGLNIQQSLFVDALTTAGTYVCGKLGYSYAEAYNIDVSPELYEKDKTQWTKNYNTACVNASRLLKNAKIKDAVRDALDNGPFSDVIVDVIMTGMAHSRDPDVAMSAIREINKVKGRIKQKIDITEYTSADVLDLLRKKNELLEKRIRELENKEE